MDIESGDDLQQEIQCEQLSQRNDKKLELSNEAESLASSIHSKRNKHTQLNHKIDQNNIAQKLYMGLKVKQFGSFKHFLTKNKNRDSRLQVLNVVRDLASQKNIVLNGRIKDKLEHCSMIVRVLSKEQGSNIVVIQDETGKQKLQIRSGFAWVGMIACMEMSWSDGIYKMNTMFDLGEKINQQKVVLRQPNMSYRILFVKGSFWKDNSNENIGLKILTNQIRTLKQKERIRLDSIVIMGPLLNKKNTLFKSGFSQKTYDQQAIDLIKLIKEEIHKINEDIEIVFVPSTDDITSFYPIPQPKYSYESQIKAKNVYFTSNPGFIHLSSRQNYRIDIINTDILSYIDENKAGKSTKDVLQENLQTYFKQPFMLTNTLDEPLDETNLPGLYNKGQFGDIIVTSSQRSPPYARDIKGRVFVNIGCLGIDMQQTVKHYMTLLSIYDGDGPLGQRTKIQVISM